MDESQTELSITAVRLYNVRQNDYYSLLCNMIVTDNNWLSVSMGGGGEGGFVGGSLPTQ